MFSRLLKPKWEHADPRKRQTALMSGNVPAEVIVKVAREDKDPNVRCCAIERVEDLDLLSELALADVQTRIRDVAEQRLQALLVNPFEQGPTLAQRLDTIRHTKSPDLCSYLVKNSDSAEIREAALEHVMDTGLLCSVAVGDMVKSVRHKALEQINDPEGWEVVSRKARNRDKQISRAARERLEVYRKAQSDLQTAEGLCEDLDNLLALECLQLDSPGYFRRLTGKWDKLDSVLPSELNERYNKASEQVCVRIEQFEAQLATRRSICADLEVLLERFNDNEVMVPDSHEGIEEAIHKAAEQWQKAGPMPDKSDPVFKRYDNLLKQLRKAVDQQASDAKRAKRQRDLIQRAKALSENSSNFDDSQIKDLQKRWDQLDNPELKSLTDSLEQEFVSVLHTLKEQVKKQHAQRKQALEEAEVIITELEKALKQGELEHALSLRDRAGHRLKKAKGIAEQQRKLLQDRLNGMRAKLEDLRQWRHWGSGHAREHLCSEIESLMDNSDNSLNPDSIAAKVRSARKAWQRIDHAEGPAEESLWQRFDQACTHAYEPYQQERKKQEAILDQHLADKRALCRELDEFERNTDWDNVDWREADQHIHKAREKWRRIGAVPRKSGKTLEKNYHAVLGRLESHLSPERERELRRRKGLISRMEELAKSSDLRAASREAKQAQDQWKPTVPLARKEEQELWQQFRTACDAIFDQLREERETADAERKANLECKRGICTELEELLDNTDVKYREINKRFIATQEAWAGVGEIPRKEERVMESRYETIQKRLAERRDQELKQETEALLQGMKERAIICLQLENEVLACTLEADARMNLIEQKEKAWKALPSWGEQYERPMQTRYELAIHALNGDTNAVKSLQGNIAKNLQRRLELCLALEVATGVESPAEYREERMQYQVSRLSDAFHQKFTEEQSQEDQLQDLQITWLQTGPVQPDLQQGLEHRFERALARAV